MKNSITRFVLVASCVSMGALVLLSKAHPQSASLYESSCTYDDSGTGPQRALTNPYYQAPCGTASGEYLIQECNGPWKLDANGVTYNSPCGGPRKPLASFLVTGVPPYNGGAPQNGAYPMDEGNETEVYN